MKILAITGTWDKDGGKPSGYCRKLFKEIFYELEYDEIEFKNGGYWDQCSLEENGWVNSIRRADVIFWFPNISNSETKVLKEIKKINSKCILIASKNNPDDKYSYYTLAKRMLKTKINLLLSLNPQQFTTRKVIFGTLLDPLGNMLSAKDESQPGHLGALLAKRVKQLYGFTRMNSVSISETPLEVPNNKEFFEIVRKYSNVFHDLIHGKEEDTERFMGNASFRCESGFPSFRDKNLIFVSRRNVDKRQLDRENFVAVNLDGNNQVEYYGTVKPSVDTPIQVKLYNYYSRVKYILHSHVYVLHNNGFFPFETEGVISCGALQEFDAIVKEIPYRDMINFSVNLKGHGSLVLTDSLDKLKNIQYIARVMPEQYKVCDWMTD